jgi:hypothetical protein
VSQIAFNIVKLGQIAEARGDWAAAKERYEQGLAIFARLGMPEANQVRAFLRSLEAGDQAAAQLMSPAQVVAALTGAAGDVLAGKADAAPLLAAIGQAQAQLPLPAAQAAWLGALAAWLDTAGAAQGDQLASAAAALAAGAADEEQLPLLEAAARLLDRLERPAAAAALQQQAVDFLRTRPAARATQEQLSILLFNLSNFLGNAGQLDAAVAALEEVVAIDERWQLPDLASDRQALAALRGDTAEVTAADAPPAPLHAAEFAAALRSHMAQLPPAERAQAEAALAQFEQLSPAEQQALLAAGARTQAEAALAEEADGLVATALAAAAAGTAAALAPKLEAAADVYAEGVAADSPYGQLAQFARALAAHLTGAPPRPVPPALAEHFAAFTHRLAPTGGRTP